MLLFQVHGSRGREQRAGAVCTAASSPTLTAPHGRAPGLPAAGGTVLGEAVLARPRVEVEVGRGNWIACILRRHTSGFAGACVCFLHTTEKARRRDGVEGDATVCLRNWQAEAAQQRAGEWRGAAVWGSRRWGPSLGRAQLQVPIRDPSRAIVRQVESGTGGGGVAGR